MRPIIPPLSFGATFAALLTLLALGGCLAPQGESTPRLGSESHFLMSCFAESECPAGLGCICGVCTVSCQSETQCSPTRLGGSATDFSTVCSAEVGLGTAALCGPFTEPPGLCVAECSVDAECGSVPGRFVCDLGRCRDVDLPSNGLDATVNDVSDAGIDDAAASDTDGSQADATVDVDDLELVACEGDLVSTLAQLDELAGCQRITSDLTIRDIDVTSEAVAGFVDVQGAFRVLNVTVLANELRFEGLRRVTGDFTVQAVTGAGAGVSAPSLETALNVDVAGLDTAALRLDSLSEVTGSLVIADGRIESLSLGALRSVGDTLSVRDVLGLRVIALPSLLDADALELEGLTDVESVNASRLSGAMTGLSLTALSSVLTLDVGSPVVSDAVRVQRMNTWTDLSALDGVSTTPGLDTLIVSENALLRTTEGFAMTTSLAPGALLNVERNPRLTALGTFTNIATIGDGARISVSVNAQLPQCEVAAWLVEASNALTEETISDVASGNDDAAVCDD